MSRVFLLCLLLMGACGMYAQNKCPANIGFESGSFEGWECGAGTIDRNSGVISLNFPTPPLYNRHTLIHNTQPQARDKYGGFPVSPPNGSEYSIQLGNDATGAQAEQVSYTFRIPDDQHNYSIIYYYAVVFQDPVHSAAEQPKFTANVYDVNVGNYIGCSSFSFTASKNLPGFKRSSISDSVFYKEWTPVTIKLSGMAGRTIRIEFTTNDCSRGGHFGYAYVDVSQNCTSPVTGNVYCASSKEVKLVPPFGFAEYHWYTDDFSTKLGNTQVLTLSPVPPPNTKYAVEVIPFVDQGCPDTIYTTVVYSPEPLELQVKSTAYACVTTGLDLTASNITAGSSGNLSLSYFTDPDLIRYVSFPKKVLEDGDYYIQAENQTGCTIAKKIAVVIEPLPVFKLNEPPDVYRPGTVDLTKMIVSTVAYNYDYWLDSPATKELQSPHFIDKTGKYYVIAHNVAVPDCAVMRGVNIKILDPIITAPNIFTPNGDGVNDTWLIPQLSYYPECILEIYDRSGHMLWRSNPGYTKPWDGKSQGKDLPVDTYYYLIKLNEELHNIGGSITIMR